VDLGNDVDAAEREVAALGHAQRHVQRRAILGRVDDVAAKHRRDPLAEAARFREGDEAPHRLVGYAVLRVVEVETRGLDDEALAAPGVAREQLAQVQRSDLGVVGDERLPGRQRRQLGRVCPGRDGAVTHREVAPLS
jgi:hypothetical protein